MTPNKILWIYIVLLFLGGLVGYLKAGSKMSLIMAAAFAAVLSLCASGVIFQPRVADLFADVLLAVLLVFFAVRLTKTKKFIPNGLMSVLSLGALVLRHLKL
ncbi:MAG TPA: TMEM14 family protein [Candidatus Angelobacter sp.]|nr:TMEM14 family protein [Candidatus Angelobacter sp.]